MFCGRESSLSLLLLGVILLGRLNKLREFILLENFDILCKICDKQIKCGHMGKKDVVKHCQTQTHLDQALSLQSQSRIRFNTPESSEFFKRIEAELKIAVLTASSNIPMAFHDVLSPTINKVFPDSGIATKYHSASTKATCMLNLAVAPMLVDNLVQHIKIHPFSLSTDGSNDTGLEKMNPATVRIYDTNENCIVTRFLDMCPTTSSTAEGIL